jgi:tRNA (adenine22-N1)-methyltransferase
MPLEPRLLAAAHFIDSDTHADIGSDHALLPKYLLEICKVKRAIVVEKNQQPFENAKATLRGLNADIRLGDGLEPLRQNETDSLSITGMGAAKIAQILQAHPERLPSKLTLQANDNARAIRVWARAAGFHLKAETMVEGFWRYSILHFEANAQSETIYDDVPLEPALTYGPHLLKAKHPLLRAELEYQLPYLQKLGEHGAKQLETLKQALDYLGEARNPQ